MNEGRFKEHVTEILDTLPKEILGKIGNVEIIVEDEPTPEQLKKLKLSPHVNLYGLYEGVPQDKPGEDRAFFPDKITLFRLPILSSGVTEEEIKEQIRDTLFHEIGHYFGMTEEELRRIPK